MNVGGQIIVQVAQGAGQVDFVVDTNGYYGSTPPTRRNRSRSRSNFAGHDQHNELQALALTAVFANQPLRASCGIGVCGKAPGIGHGFGQHGVRNQLGRLGFADGRYQSDGRANVTERYEQRPGGSRRPWPMAPARRARPGCTRTRRDGAPLTLPGAPFRQLECVGDSQTVFGVLGVSSVAFGVSGYLVQRIRRCSSRKAFWEQPPAPPSMRRPVHGESLLETLAPRGEALRRATSRRTRKKVILYSSIEGRTVDTYFRGTAAAVNHEASHRGARRIFASSPMRTG